MRVRLAPGRDPNQAIGELNQLIGEMSLVLSANVANKHASYIRWSADTETKLQSILRREDAMAFFNTPRHLAICGMTPTMHLNPLLVAQLDALRYELGEAVEYLTRQRDRMGASGGLPIVTDTNVLLQCQRLDQVKWAPVVGEGARLMVPLRVIEEIEDKKYSDSKRLAGELGNCCPGSTSTSPMAAPVQSVWPRGRRSSWSSRSVRVIGPIAPTMRSSNLLRTYFSSRAG